MDICEVSLNTAQIYFKNYCTLPKIAAFLRQIIHLNVTVLTSRIELSLRNMHTFHMSYTQAMACVGGEKCSTSLAHNYFLKFLIPHPNAC